MTNEQIETHLRHASRATEPPASLVSDVMKRIGQVDVTHRASDRTVGTYRIYRAAAFLVAAAACVAALLLALHAGRAPDKHPQIVHLPPTRPAERDADSFPRLVDYRQAYMQSSDAFDALLQQRPVEAGAAPSHEFRAADSLRSDINLYQ